MKTEKPSIEVWSGWAWKREGIVLGTTWMLKKNCRQKRSGRSTRIQSSSRNVDKRATSTSLIFRRQCHELVPLLSGGSGYFLLMLCLAYHFRSRRIPSGFFRLFAFFLAFIDGFPFFCSSPNFMVVLLLFPVSFCPFSFFLFPLLSISHP